MSELGAWTLAAVIALATPAAAQEGSLQDPLRPPASGQSEAAARAAPEPFRLSAVLISSSRRIAVVNGRVHLGGTLLLSPAWDLVEPEHLVEWMLADGLPARLNLQLHKYVWDPATTGV